jgi:hypothetical protein
MKARLRAARRSLLPILFGHADTRRLILPQGTYMILTRILTRERRMKIDCLMGTYGRHALASEALACFLEQSAMSEATLLIYNQHWIPLRVGHPRVRVVNEAPPAGSLRYIRHRMHELADPNAEFIHWWDDDDLYLPWHLEECLEHIGKSVAWKPASSWMSVVNVEYSRHANTFEGSWVFSADYLKSALLDTHPTYTDHPVILQTQEAGLLAMTEFGDRTSYIYRWGIGTAHVSGYGGSFTEQMQRANLEAWRNASNDMLPDGLLVPADLTQRWQEYLDGTKELVPPDDWEINRAALRANCRTDPCRPNCHRGVSGVIKRSPYHFDLAAMSALGHQLT